MPIRILDLHPNADWKVMFILRKLPYIRQYRGDHTIMLPDDTWSRSTMVKALNNQSGLNGIHYFAVGDEERKLWLKFLKD